MKKKRNVQVFLVRPEEHSDNCEVSAELVDYTIRQDCIELKTKEEDGSEWLHIFPLHNVSMVRIS